MSDPGDHTAQRPTETLQVGPSRPPLFQKVPARWRQPAVALAVFALGVAAGVAATTGGEEPEPKADPFRVDEHAVELMLFAVAPPRTAGNPLQVDSAVLLSGAVTSTVLAVRPLDRSLIVRAPALPVTVSPTARLQSVTLEIVVRDCRAARAWTPTDRPFTIRWRDEHGRSHLDRAGDFDRSVARSLTRYVDSVCGNL